MTQRLLFLCIAFLSALGLASCNLSGGSSGGTQLKNPTVDEMAELEKKWGVQPRGVRSRHVPIPGESEMPLAPPLSEASQVATPDPVPLPQTPTPPLFEQPPQPATPAQIQKLKN